MCCTCDKLLTLQQPLLSPQWPQFIVASHYHHSWSRPGAPASASSSSDLPNQTGALLYGSARQSVNPPPHRPFLNLQRASAGQTALLVQLHWEGGESLRGRKHVSNNRKEEIKAPLVKTLCCRFAVFSPVIRRLAGSASWCGFLLLNHRISTRAAWHIVHRNPLDVLLSGVLSLLGTPKT